MAGFTIVHPLEPQTLVKAIPSDSFFFAKVRYVSGSSIKSHCCHKLMAKTDKQLLLANNLDPCIYEISIPRSCVNILIFPIKITIQTPQINGNFDSFDNLDNKSENIH